LTAKYPDDTRLLIEAGLKEYFPKKRNPELIYEAMSHSLFSGGKRFRGILVIEAAKLLGATPEEVMPTACAVEYIHTYSLIHDDLPAIDDDDLRRGKPTCHILFGEAMAILAGDALFTEAFSLIAGAQKTGDRGRVVDVVWELSSAAGVTGMVGGQVVDIISEGRGIDAATLEFIHENKTGALIKASVRAGSILAGASESELAGLSSYAGYLGLAFQITDDVLDVVGDTEVLGKTAGSDAKLGKATYPSVYGLKEAKAMAESVVGRAKEALNGLSGDTAVLRNLADFVYERQF
jgi:geranylgeranyl diphosphate synthase type II